MELHYFLTTNGSKGHKSFKEHAFDSFRDVIYLSGFPRSVAASLLLECYTIAKQSRMNIDVIHNCLDNSMEGIVLPDLKTAVMNVPLYEPRTDITTLFKNDALSLYHAQMEKAYDAFAEAKDIHDEWEKIYITSTDYAALDQFSKETVERLLSGHSTTHPGSICHRFFGSATINGSVDFINLLSSGTKRYFIKGRPGTGKSTFLKKVTAAACDKGFHVECYHCSFDPNSLDMVVIRELNLCLFDATAPHEYDPSLPSDEVLDVYAAAVKPDTDTVFAKEIKEIARCYRAAIDNAIKHIIAANEACLRAENDFGTQIDGDALMTLRKNIISRLLP
ncbi:MAG: hypothetical protein IKW06_02780 [Clostridia bacterium]|nr:hypothetical protein [Clostridia bacterium]